MDRNNTDRYGLVYDRMSLSARRAWIEIMLKIGTLRSTQSLSARRAWIEIFRQNYECFQWIVALRKESVDRNFLRVVSLNYKEVSLSARRAWIEIHRDATLRLWACVALRKESVDRNATSLLVYLALIRSLSARRAWIEICYLDNIEIIQASLSARRAWIEIFVPFDVIRPAIVALRKESVDRNFERAE